jgi:outer membrane protein OmpU
MLAEPDQVISAAAKPVVATNDNGESKVHTEIDLGMAATGETDGGIGWKVEMGLDTDQTDSTGAAVGDAGSVALSGDFGTIRVGAVSTAGTSIGLPDLGFDGIGIDDVAELGRNAGGGHDIQWNYAMDEIALMVSVDTSDDDMAVSAKWSSGSLAIGISHAAAGATGGADATAASIGTSVGGFAVNIWLQAIVLLRPTQ